MRLGSIAIKSSKMESGLDSQGIAFVNKISLMLGGDELIVGFIHIYLMRNNFIWSSLG